jgi:hypothetical protein
LKEQTVNFGAWHPMVPAGRHHGSYLALVDPLLQSRVAHTQLPRRILNVKEFHGEPLIKYNV